MPFNPESLKNLRQYVPGESGNPGGSTNARKGVPQPTPGMERLHALIEDPDSEPSEVCRLITLEISAVSRDLVALRNANRNKVRGHSEAIRALKEMRQSLMDTEGMARKDTLNMDGPKFILVMHRTVDWFVQAMREAGVPEGQRSSVLRAYRDIWNTGEPGLRRNVARAGSPRASDDIAGGDIQ